MDWKYKLNFKSIIQLKIGKLQHIRHTFKIVMVLLPRQPKLGTLSSITACPR